MIDKNTFGKNLTKTEANLARSLVKNLHELQVGLKQDWLRSSMPDGGEALEDVEPKKTRVTLNLDADIVKRFRALGPGYQRRINQILRIYTDAAASGKIRTEPELLSMGPNYLSPLLELLIRTAMAEVEMSQRPEKDQKEIPSVASFMVDFLQGIKNVK